MECRNVPSIFIRLLSLVASLSMFSHFCFSLRPSHPETARRSWAGRSSLPVPALVCTHVPLATLPVCSLGRSYRCQKHWVEESLKTLLWASLVGEATGLKPVLPAFGPPTMITFSHLTNPGSQPQGQVTQRCFPEPWENGVVTNT